jgi:transposase
LSTKIHQLVDGHGLPLVSICTAGQDGDSPMLAPLLDNLQVGRRTRPDAVLGDKAYSSRANRSLLRSRKIEAVISEPSDQQGHRLRRGSKGGRPPKFDAIKYKGRNVIERGYARLKQWRGLATRYDKLAVVYRAAVVLNGVIAWLQHLSDTPYITEAHFRWYDRHFLGDTDAAGRLDELVSPLFADDLSGLAPAYVAVAGHDPLRDEGEEYAGRLAEAGVPVTVRRHRGLVHPFVNSPAIWEDSRQALDEAVGAVRLTFGI